MNSVDILNSLIDNFLNDSKRKKSVLRSNCLIVNIQNNDFINMNWEYPLSFAFKDALDIQFSERVKNEFVRTKNPNDFQRENETSAQYQARKKGGIPRPKEQLEMYWSQGIFISFKQGDTFHHRDKKTCIEVKQASPCAITSDEKFSKGIVLFHEYSIDEKGKYTLINADDIKSCTQIDFLSLLVTGDKTKFKRR